MDTGDYIVITMVPVQTNALRMQNGHGEYVSPPGGSDRLARRVRSDAGHEPGLGSRGETPVNVSAAPDRRPPKKRPVALPRQDLLLLTPTGTVLRVTELEPGLYESLITRELRVKLDNLSSTLITSDRRLGTADAADRIAWHVSRQVERSLLDVSDEDRVDVALKVAQALLDRLGEVTEVDRGAHLIDPASVLHAILRRLPDGQPEDLEAR
jgi:hypothetical protein